MKICWYCSTSRPPRIWVKKFERLRQVSQKNGFDFGFSMEFASQQDYDTYNKHPDHVQFVETRWKPEVADFMEIDYIPLV